MRLLRVRHVTTYRHAEPVSFGDHRMMFRQRTAMIWGWSRPSSRSRRSLARCVGCWRSVAGARAAPAPS